MIILKKNIDLYPDEIYDWILGFKGKLPKIALMGVYPKHIEYITEEMEKKHLVGQNLPRVVYLGEYKGVPITTVTSGVGAPNTAMTAEALIRKGTKVIIRVGMAGAISPNIFPGELVIATGAVRDEGTSYKYIHKKAPAVPDFLVTETLFNVAKELNITYHLGVIWSHDAFFRENLNLFEFWYRNGAVAVDMETAALFAVAILRKVKSGAIMAISENVLTGERYSSEQLRKKLRSAIKIETKVALEAAVRLFEHV